MALSRVLPTLNQPGLCHPPPPKPYTPPVRGHSVLPPPTLPPHLLAVFLSLPIVIRTPGLQTGLYTRFYFIAQFTVDSRWLCNQPDGEGRQQFCPRSQKWNEHTHTCHRIKVTFSPWSSPECSCHWVSADYRIGDIPGGIRHNVRRQNQECPAPKSSVPYRSQKGHFPSVSTVSQHVLLLKITTILIPTGGENNRYDSFLTHCHWKFRQSCCWLPQVLPLFQLKVYKVTQSCPWQLFILQFGFPKL